ncbi:MAG: hypothetical protein EZS28_006260 [Streblomastix strix]|uniref:Zn(2)-C6 fungal-type domain-containing protein n=1 Tax=Streblomastix strix TaxID=222440 RepID=A0A5J4WT38_9EUKA|nr:MAG: hypothetical protein EZS28_006260 [Streblomastix strix]
MSVNRLVAARACDMCRKKKIKCDGLQPQCSACKLKNVECKYENPVKRRGPQSKKDDPEQHNKENEGQNVSGKSQPQFLNSGLNSQTSINQSNIQQSYYKNTDQSTIQDVDALSQLGLKGVNTPFLDIGRNKLIYLEVFRRYINQINGFFSNDMSYFANFPFKTIELLKHIKQATLRSKQAEKDKKQVKKSQNLDHRDQQEQIKLTRLDHLLLHYFDALHLQFYSIIAKSAQILELLEGCVVIEILRGISLLQNTFVFLRGAPIQKMSVNRLVAARACDMCRKKKIKCDGLQPQCSACKLKNVECKYENPVKRRGPQSKKDDPEQHNKENEGQNVSGKSQPQFLNSGLNSQTSINQSNIQQSYYKNTDQSTIQDVDALSQLGLKGVNTPFLDIGRNKLIYLEVFRRYINQINGFFSNDMSYFANFPFKTIELLKHIKQATLRSKQAEKDKKQVKKSQNLDHRDQQEQIKLTRLDHLLLHYFDALHLQFYSIIAKSAQILGHNAMERFAQQQALMYFGAALDVISSIMSRKTFPLTRLYRNTQPVNFKVYFLLTNRTS